jgi:hypothetical protein
MRVARCLSILDSVTLAVQSAMATPVAGQGSPPRLLHRLQRVGNVQQSRSFEDRRTMW